MVAGLLWRVSAGMAVVGAGVAARKLLERGWERTTGTPPPEHPEEPDTSWREAFGWAAASGLAVGLARLLARRTATAGWRKATGGTPPGVPDRA